MKLQENQQKRLVPKFDDDENKKLNNNIKKLVYEITQKLKECEQNIKQLINENSENDIDNQIKLNMQQTIFSKLSDFTKKFKLNQEIYSKKYKELVGEDDPTYDTTSVLDKNNLNNDNNNKMNNFLMTDVDNTVLRKRDNELNNLLNSVNDLAAIFKDMQTLVMEQGSILDRIDYNIDLAADNVVHAKKSVVKAEQYQKKNCFRNVIIVLLVVIFIEAIMLILKFI